MSTIKVERIIKAPASEIYIYFTNSTAVKDWLCDVATADPRPGGRLYMWWNSGYYSSGEYLKVEKDKLISFTWFGRGEPHATSVVVDFKGKKAGTLVRLVHRKLGKNQKWIAISDEYQKQWTKGLDNLASVLENGADLRITSRPMLGITINDFNPSVAEKLGVPVNQGLRLGGLVEGMGAEKAGLKVDDVITRLDDYEITGGSSFGTYIHNKHAGDEIDVTYYRCSEKKTTKMILSGRPIPPIPASGVELAHQVEPIYRQFESELEALLKDASEEVCAKKPGPSEWSVNEVLAHLIHSERGAQSFVSETIGGYEGAYDGFGGNVQAHIDATVTTFRTKVELFHELKNHDAETLNLYEHIPDDFLSHKGKFWKLVLSVNQSSYHLQTHIEQIKAVIQAAK